MVIPDELNLIFDKLCLLTELIEPEPLIWRCTIDNDNLPCGGQNAKDRFKGTRKVMSNGDNSVVVGQTGKLDATLFDGRQDRLDCTNKRARCR